MRKNSRGIVYLVGAGPGDPELITVKGKQLLNDCDVVVFDNLVPDELIVSLPYNIEIHYAGKITGVHSLPQNEINSLLIKLANEGKKVVRLKGGDPFIFGRGSEEAKYLKKNGIRFEIVPGITAGSAAPAYCGIPCTDRNKASSVSFVTGHKAKDKDKSSVHWEQLAKIRHNTIVVYMGVNEIENITRNLIDNGFLPETPAAVIERGTLPSQRIVSSPLKKLSSETTLKNIKPPAIIIIGEVVNYHEELAWFANKPLFGKRIMVTRPVDQSQYFYKSLRSLGAEVLPYPTIATESYSDPDAWESFYGIVNNHDDSDRWLVFTSENGVRYFIEQLCSNDGDIRQLAGFKIAAVGKGTARILKSFKLSADFMPAKATTGALTREMESNFNLAGSTIVRIRGNLADDSVEKSFELVGASIIPLQVYRTFYPSWHEALKGKLLDNPADVIIFTSGSTVEGLHKLLDETEIRILSENAIIVSIGPVTSGIILSKGIDIAIEAKEHSIDGITGELVKYFMKNK